MIVRLFYDLYNEVYQRNGKGGTSFMKKEYEILFTPAKIGSCEIKNRFIMCPMASTAMVEWTQKPIGYNPAVHDLLVNRAKDGAGLIIPGAIGVFSWAGNACLGDHPEAFAGVKETVEEIHSYGSKIFFQLTAGLGRNLPLLKELYEKKEQLKPAMDLDFIDASADTGLPNRWINEMKSRALTKEEIHMIVDGIARTAHLCKENGVDGIDIHAIHEGYLLDQFACAYTNHRTDEYGGSLENRLRFACEIVKAIKETCGQDYPVILRYSITSHVKAFNKGIIPADTKTVDIGRNFEESKEAIRILSEAGYDGFNADNGTYDSWYYAHPPVYMPLNCNLKEAIDIKPYTEKPIICAGRMQLAEAADAIEKEQLDFIGIARQFLADEKFLTKIREEREADIIPCISCHLGCMPIGLWKDSGCQIGQVGACALNPFTSNEKKFAVAKAEHPKSLAVIGAGIAGMEFALQAARRGHHVAIYEKSDRLGGVFNEAACFSFKEKDRDLIRYYATQMKKHKIDIRFNTEIENLDTLDADEIIVATGSAAERKLDVPGAQLCTSALEFLNRGMPCDDKIVVIGGGLTGCEIAYELAKSGKHPVLIEAQDDILKVLGSSMANTSYLRDAFEFYQVPVYTDAKVLEVTEAGVVMEDKDQNKHEIPADTVVVSIGYECGTPFDTDNEHVHVIGDAEKVGNLRGAILAANELVISL